MFLHIYAFFQRVREPLLLAAATFGLTTLLLHDTDDTGLVQHIRASTTIRVWRAQITDYREDSN
jgi:hypothetical protein